MNEWTFRWWKLRAEPKRSEKTNKETKRRRLLSSNFPRAGRNPAEIEYIVERGPVIGQISRIERGYRFLPSSVIVYSAKRDEITAAADFQTGEFEIRVAWNRKYCGRVETRNVCAAARLERVSIHFLPRFPANYQRAVRTNRGRGPSNLIFDSACRGPRPLHLPIRYRLI